MRVPAGIFGILLRLPGLCLIGYGPVFSVAGSGLTPLGLVGVAIGGLITWGGVLMIVNYSR